MDKFATVKIAGAAARRGGKERRPTSDSAFNKVAASEQNGAVLHHLALAWFRGFDLPHEADWLSKEDS